MSNYDRSQELFCPLDVTDIGASLMNDLKDYLPDVTTSRKPVMERYHDLINHVLEQFYRAYSFATWFFLDGQGQVYSVSIYEDDHYKGHFSTLYLSKVKGMTPEEENDFIDGVIAEQETLYSDKTLRLRMIEEVLNRWEDHMVYQLEGQPIMQEMVKALCALKRTELHSRFKLETVKGDKNDQD